MKAFIELNDTVFERNGYEGESPSEIVTQLMRDQDLECLCRMVPIYGDDVSQLHNFVEKYYSGNLNWNDIKYLNIELSIEQ